MKKIMLPFTLLFAFPILAQEVLKLEWIVDAVVERNPQIKFLPGQNLMAYMEKMLWIKPLGFLLLLMHGQCQ